MDDRTILIVDDEPNIRLTLAQTLEGLGAEVLTAVNGEDALRVVAERSVEVLLLDLKMPGMGGMEVLRRIASEAPTTRVVIITAHGSVSGAVEAMKLGAADFLQKPFSLDEVRSMVNDVLSREAATFSDAETYEDALSLAKKAINARRFDVAEESARRAIGMEASRPDGFNLLGAIVEVRGDRRAAQRLYRVALDLDPTYRAAADNLSRTTRASWSSSERHGPSLD
jgi:DNA-binding NtrC family response regulator